MIFRVCWGDLVAHKVAERYGRGRSPAGRADENDFLNGPLAAATLAFRDFDRLPHAAGPAVRSVHVLDPIFGVVVFVGVLVGPGLVEIADFEDDPDYWSEVAADPDE